MTAQPPEITDYRSASEFLFGRINYERTRRVPYRSRRFKLDRMRQLMARVGNPERAFPAVHIAGTKGKGSTAGMIASTLSTAGYRTGLYTSPHLHRLEERFVVDGHPCSENELVALLSRLQGAVIALDDEARGRGELQGPTYFEITTAAALLHFRDRGVDCAVLEVGLGGRLDSTNVCHPMVSVITSISLDHTRQLGKTLALIAGEKAGIIKPGVPVVTGVVEREPFEVIARVARDHGSRLLALGHDFRFEYLPELATAVRRDDISGDLLCGLDYCEQIDGTTHALNRVALGLLGRHQAANASVALATLGQLRRRGWRIDESATRVGLAHAHCPARIEVLSRSPTTILDAAHNPASIAALLDLLAEKFPREPRLLVFATSADKEVHAMLEQLLPRFEHVVLTRYQNNPRSADPEQLAMVARSVKESQRLAAVNIHARPGPESAWRLIQSLATPTHLVCVTGSFFLAAEIRQHMESPRPVVLECP